MSEVMHAILNAGVAELAPVYAGSVVSPVEAVEHYLARIDAINPRLNAFLFVDRAGAHAAARRSAARWAAGAPASRLDGAPIGLKANIAVEGWPWHGGVAAYRDRIAASDADCVARLKAAGAVLLGGLNMDEAALGGTNDNPAFGRCRNPHDPERTPGGSSGGSAAAVAAGLCAAALGTDTLGSVRIPASYCGVFGCKPRFGAVSTAGVAALCASLDTVGVIARSVRDIEAMLEVLAPATLGGRLSLAGADGLRLGAMILPEVSLERDVSRAFEATLERARAGGAQVEVIAATGRDVLATRKAALLVTEAGGFVEHEAMLVERPDGFTPALTALLTWGARQPAATRALAYRRLEAVARQLRETVSAFDAVLTPTTPQAAFSFEAAPPSNQADFTLLANIAGLPALAFPAAASANRLPTSVQVMAASESMCLRVAERLTVPITTPR